MRSAPSSHPATTPAVSLPPAAGGPVLLASDGRAPTDATAHVARIVADRTGRDLEVVAVLPPLPTSIVGYEVSTVLPDVESGRIEDLHDTVVHRLEPVLGARTRWRLDVRYGDPGRVIGEVARERRASLVVVGTGAHGIADRLLGGEVPLQLVRHGHAPVLAVAPQATGAFRHVVVGIDFSAASIRAAQAALALADVNAAAGALPESGEHGASVVTLVHVRSIADHRLLGAVEWDARSMADVSSRFARLQALLRPHVPTGVVLETRVRAGGVVECLDEAVRETGADLVAVGTHGPGWVERWMVGSVATDALRTLPVSVLVAPAPESESRVQLELRVSGQVTLDEPTDWPDALGVFTRRNLGRRARLATSGGDLAGLTEAAEDYRFCAATYDPRHQRVEFVLEDPNAPARHLTHGISRVRSLDIIGDSETSDRALLVDFPGGEAVLTFSH
jgi:nucleotide-binding universal stress UspA family protein